jgi:hypothetical protein
MKLVVGALGETSNLYRQQPQVRRRVLIIIPLVGCYANGRGQRGVQ